MCHNFILGVDLGTSEAKRSCCRATAVIESTTLIATHFSLTAVQYVYNFNDNKKLNYR